MKALVVGLGGIGRRHVLNLKAIDPSIEITAWRPRNLVPIGEDVATLLSGVVTRQEDAVAWHPDFAIVATPATLHIEVGLALAEAGAHLFIEKPLSDRLTDINEVLDLCRSKSLVLMVGYNLRFEPSLRAIRQALEQGAIGRMVALRTEAGQFLPDWRPGRDYRQTASARRNLGGGVLLELSHELDYACWLAGDVTSVSAQVARLSDLALDVEDLAEVTLEFATGAIGNVHLDMIQRTRHRLLRIIGTEGTLVWDGVAREARQFRVVDGTWATLATGTDPNESYLAAMRFFLDCIRNGEAPSPSGEEGRRVLEIISAARESSSSGRRVRL